MTRVLPHKFEKSSVQSSLKRKEGGGGYKNDESGQESRGMAKKNGGPNTGIRNIVNKFIKPEHWVRGVQLLAVSALRQDI